MSSVTTPRRPLATSSNSANSARATGPDHSPVRPSTLTSSSYTPAQGLARSPSLRQQRPLRKTLSRSSTSVATEDADEEQEVARAANADLIAQLRDQVKRAEEASSRYRQQIDVLQRRLDEIIEEQTAAEEREYQRQSQVDSLMAEMKDLGRQNRDIQQSHATEVNALMNDRETQAAREAELQTVIQRLNETLRSRELRRSSIRQDDQNEPDLPPPPSTEPSIGDILQEKNKAIDSLRLDLAEAHIKLAEMEHVGDGHSQDLEKALMDVKMQNARLREDNESFQYLLSEKTLKGEFMHEARASNDTSGLSSLAEELETAGDEDETGQTEHSKKLDAEVKSLREENKALTLYVDRIIGRILKHEGAFEMIITDNEDAPEAPERTAKMPTTEKALPATPAQPALTELQSTGASFLQRARSVVARQPAAKPRPTTQMPSSTSANEHPDTAPSIPLNRGHRRARSDQAQNDLGAAAVVQQMNRGSPLRTVSGGAMSPGISALSPQLHPQRTSYFQGAPGTTGRTSVSGTTPQDRSSSANSVASEVSGEKDSTDASSAPTSNPGSGNIPPAVMKQNQLRPLRLVKEQNDELEAQKKANRGSWMGWLKGANPEN